MTRLEHPSERVRRLETEIALLKRDGEAWRALLQKSMQVLGALKNRAAEVVGGNHFKIDGL